MQLSKGEKMNINKVATYLGIKEDDVFIDGNKHVLNLKDSDGRATTVILEIDGALLRILNGEDEPYDSLNIFSGEQEIASTVIRALHYQTVESW